MSLSSSLEAAFEFDSNALDSTSHAHTGTEQGGPTYAAGKIANAIVFGGGSRVRLSGTIINAQPTAGDAFSIEVWLNPSALPASYGTILAENAGARGLYLKSDGTMSYWDFFAGSDHLSTTALSTGVYTHVVFTYAGASGNWKFYINNVLSGSGSGSALQATSLEMIGADFGGPLPYSGQVDMLRVWATYELSATEISQLYNGGAGITYPAIALFDGLVSYWNMNNNVLDSQGVNNGTAHNLSYMTGRIAQGVTGNGTSSWVDLGVGTGLNITGDLTIAAWCYRTSNNYLFIMCRTTGSGAGASTYEFRINSGGALEFLTYSGGGGATGSGTIPLNVWSFVCATRSGATCKVFVDGVKVGTGTCLAPTSLPAENTIIGSRQDGISYLGSQGYALDDVGIWNRALTEDEVSNLWSSSEYPLIPSPYYPMYTEFMFGDDDIFADFPLQDVEVYVADLDYDMNANVYANDLSFNVGFFTGVFQVRMAEEYGGAGPIVIPPVVSNMVPASGTPIYPNTTIQFDVTDDSGLFTAIIVMVSFPDGSYEVIHDSAQFAPRYRTSTNNPITNGFTFVVRRNGGWPAAPTIKVVGVDAAGGENPQ